MSGSLAARAAVEALRKVTSSFDGAEERQGQIDMSAAIAESLASGRSIIVQAGTGTGKSLGYLVPALLNGKKTVVATATKTLQDQLNRIRYDMDKERARLREDLEHERLDRRKERQALQEKIDQLIAIVAKQNKEKDNE